MLGEEIDFIQPDVEKYVMYLFPNNKIDFHLEMDGNGSFTGNIIVVILNGVDEVDKIPLIEIIREQKLKQLGIS